MDSVNYENIIEDILNEGAAYAKYFKPENLVFSSKFRKYCEDNLCGHYGSNWMCPPAVGSIEELKEKVMKFESGVVFQTLNKIEGLSDKEGLAKARDLHNDFLRNITKFIKEKYVDMDIFPMGAGQCEICNKCAYLHGEKCIHPEMAVPSAEACGIDLGELLKSCGLKFSYSEDSIAYISLLLFKYKTRG